MNSAGQFTRERFGVDPASRRAEARAAQSRAGSRSPNGSEGVRLGIDDEAVGEISVDGEALRRITPAAVSSDGANQYAIQVVMGNRKKVSDEQGQNARPSLFGVRRPAADSGPSGLDAAVAGLSVHQAHSVAAFKGRKTGPSTQCNPPTTRFTASLPGHAALRGSTVDYIRGDRIVVVDGLSMPAVWPRECQWCTSSSLIR